MHWDENQCECEGSKFLKFIDPDDSDKVLETFLQQIISRLTAKKRPDNWRLELGNQLNDAWKIHEGGDPYYKCPDQTVASMDPYPETPEETHLDHYYTWISEVGGYLRYSKSLSRNYCNIVLR